MHFIHHTATEMEAELHASHLFDMAWTIKHPENTFLDVPCLETSEQ